MSVSIHLWRPVKLPAVTLRMSLVTLRMTLVTTVLKCLDCGLSTVTSLQDNRNLMMKKSVKKMKKSAMKSLQIFTGLRGNNFITVRHFKNTTSEGPG